MHRSADYFAILRGDCHPNTFDCHKDDYFHTSPGGSNYLATHWNLGNSLNRFIDFT